MTAGYEILEHTADVGVRARGASQAELFENAAAGMLEIAYETAGVAEREQKRVAVQAGDREALLIRFLEELVWLVDGEGWLPRRVAAEEIGDAGLCALAFGEPRDPARHNIRMIIKAVTYHQLAVREAGGGWEAEVYFDI